MQLKRVGESRVVVAHLVEDGLLSFGGGHGLWVFSRRGGGRKRWGKSLLQALCGEWKGGGEGPIYGVALTVVKEKNQRALTWGTR